MPAHSSSDRILRLQHVEVRVPDLELATAYYTEVLGLVETARDERDGADRGGSPRQGDACSPGYVMAQHSSFRGGLSDPEYEDQGGFMTRTDLTSRTWNLAGENPLTSP